MRPHEDPQFFRLIAEFQVARALLEGAADALSDRLRTAPTHLIPDCLAAVEGWLAAAFDRASLPQTDIDTEDDRLLATAKREAYEELLAEFLERLKNGLPDSAGPGDDADWFR